MTSDDSFGAVDALIVTAVKDEWDAVLSVDSGSQEKSSWHVPPTRWPAAAYRKFTTPDGLLCIAVVQAFAMGREHAAMAAAAFLERHPETRCLAMCGVCAGRRGDVSLGDVIIADRAWPYDAGKLKVKDDGKGGHFQGDVDLYRIHPPEWKQSAERFRIDASAPWLKTRPLSYEAQGDWILSQLAANLDPAISQDRPNMCPDWAPVLEQLWKTERLEERRLVLTAEGHSYINQRLLLGAGKLPSVVEMKVVVGPIASGAPVLLDPTIFDRLSNESGMRKVVGLEMEVSTILTLAYLKRLEYAVAMKGVMDYADRFKSDNMKGFAARASAECLVEFLRSELPARKTRPVEITEKRMNQLASKSVAILDRRVATEFAAILARGSVSSALNGTAQTVVAALALFEHVLIEDRYGSALIGIINSEEPELRRALTLVSTSEMRHLAEDQQLEEALATWSNDPQLAILSAAYSQGKGSGSSTVPAALKQVLEMLAVARHYEACMVVHPERWPLYEYIFQEWCRRSGGESSTLEPGPNVICLANSARQQLLRGLSKKYSVSGPLIYLQSFHVSDDALSRASDLPSPITNSPATICYEFVLPRCAHG